jgi:hypothetical protein
MLKRALFIAVTLVLTAAATAEASRHSTLEVAGFCSDPAVKYSAAFTIDPVVDTLEVALSVKGAPAGAPLNCEYLCGFEGNVQDHPIDGCPSTVDAKGKLNFKTTISGPAACQGLAPKLVINGDADPIVCRFDIP